MGKWRWTRCKTKNWARSLSREILFFKGRVSQCNRASRNRGGRSNARENIKTEQPKTKKNRIIRSIHVISKETRNMKRRDPQLLEGIYSQRIRQTSIPRHGEDLKRFPRRCWSKEVILQELVIAKYSQTCTQYIQTASYWKWSHPNAHEAAGQREGRSTFLKTPRCVKASSIAPTSLDEDATFSEKASTRSEKWGIHQQRVVWIWRSVMKQGYETSV